TAIYSLSLHDALPISSSPRLRSTAIPASAAADSSSSISRSAGWRGALKRIERMPWTDPPEPTIGRDQQRSEISARGSAGPALWRSEEHTSELQSLAYL